MPGIKQVSFTSPYSAEEMAIERQRRLAEALQMQGQQPLGPTEMVGGWAIPRSPWEGLGKAAQQVSGAYQANQADEKQRALTEKMQQNMAAALREGMGAMQGSPGQTLQPSVMGGDQAGETGIANVPATPGDPLAALTAFAKDPQALSIGGPMAMQQMQRAQLVAALRGAQGGAQPPGSPQAGAGQPGQPGMPAQAQNGPQITVGGPAGGVPMEAWIQADPTGAKYMEQLAKDQAASRTLTRVSPGGFAVNQGGQAVFSAPTTEGTVTNFGAGGPRQSVVPGAVESQAAIGKTPLEKVQNADQTFSYVPRAQLAGAAMTSPIPQAPQPTRAPSPANFPRETPVQNVKGWEGRARILNSELAQEQQAFANAKTPDERQVAQQNIAAIQKELGGVPRGTAGGPPKFGQTQEQQVEQAGQTSANTEAGKEFISEMRQNYAKLRDVPATLANMDRAKGLALTEAKNFMGPFGESKLAITKFVRNNIPGMSNLNTEGVTNAEQLQSTLFNQVMDNLKKMDASPSQYQQQVMQEAFGTLRTDPQSVPKIIDVFADILRNRVAIHNDTVASAESKGTRFPYDVKVNLEPPRITGALPRTPATAADSGWTPAKEQRYQELLRKRGS